MHHIVTNLVNYSDAISFLNEVRQIGIDANITRGGISVYPDDDNQIELVKLICQKYGGRYISDIPVLLTFG